MHPEMASALADQHRRELTRLAGRRQTAASLPAPRRRAPRYRVRWSRTTLSAVGDAGRRERSWVIVISASRGVLESRRRGSCER